ncbi:hypothetical protein ASU32_07385 [Tsukamurella tyrosinosolvens]|nr:hypothetical protein ASU32_07385 [Tsukamurella tyrosinosolvens]
MASLKSALLDRVRILSIEVWDGRVRESDIERWLENFCGKALETDQERTHALHLLSKFSFFNILTIRSMLRSIYRDLFRYPLIQRARHAADSTRNFSILESEFQEELAATRFLGMGNPSESGAHLLYYFRQVNTLSKKYFIHQHEILEHAAGIEDNRIAIPGLRRLVFIDDIMGSGTQATQYSKKLLSHVRAASKRDKTPIEIWYFTLFARPDALRLVRELEFDRVETVNEIDDTEKAFSDQSRAYRGANLIRSQDGQSIAQTYGSILTPGSPLGFKDGQLLLGFEHNVPDNTLPIFWLSESNLNWEPIFPRFTKVY